VLGGAVVVGCYNWFSWDAMVDRSAPGGPYYPSSVTTTPVKVHGWVGGDGLFSIPLPGSNYRTLWVFGDTGVADANGNVIGAPSNTVAITTSSSRGAAPTSSNIHYYSRTSSGTAVEITSDATNATYPFFPHSGVDSQIALWPNHGIVLNGTLFAFLNLITRPLGPVQDSYVYAVPNVASDVSSWNVPQGTPLRGTDSQGGTIKPDTQPNFLMNWGSAVFYDAAVDSTHAYIFGSSAATTPTGIYLARATSQTITNYPSWEFLASDGTWKSFGSTTPTSVSQLKQIAQAATGDISIDRVSFANDHGVTQTRYVMVFGRPGAGDDVWVQISRSDNMTDWAVPFDPNVTSQYRWEGQIYQPGTLDPPVIGPGEDTSACDKDQLPTHIWVYAFKASWALSPAPTQGSAPLYTRYHPTLVDFSKDTIDKDTNDNRHYCGETNRFTNGINLAKMYPWCTAQGSCWNY
jgi:hypothetical protein